MAKSKRQFTAAYQKTDKWYIGWIEEVPGVNTQGKTLRELKRNLKEALMLVLEASRLYASRADRRIPITREPLFISF